MKKGILKQKSGVELKEEHDEFVKLGLTKEKAILFLFMEMTKDKSTEIGMDFDTNIGQAFNITVAINDGLVADKTTSTKVCSRAPTYVR